MAFNTTVPEQGQKFQELSGAGGAGVGQVEGALPAHTWPPDSEPGYLVPATV